MNAFSQSPSLSKECNPERINQNIGDFRFKSFDNTTMMRNAVAIPFEQPYLKARVTDAVFKGLCGFGDITNGMGTCSLFINGVFCNNLTTNQEFIEFHNLSEECIESFHGGINRFDVRLSPHGNLSFQDLVFEIEYLPGNC